MRLARSVGDRHRDPHAAAGLLIGACLNHAFLGHFTETPDDEHLPATLVHTLVGGLLPN